MGFRKWLLHLPTVSCSAGTEGFAVLCCDYAAGLCASLTAFTLLWPAEHWLGPSVTCSFHASLRGFLKSFSVRFATEQVPVF